MESLGGEAMPYSTHLQKRERRYRKFLMSAEEERNFRKQGETSWGQRLPSRSKAEKRRGGGRAHSSQASCEAVGSLRWEEAGGWTSASGLRSRAIRECLHKGLWGLSAWSSTSDYGWDPQLKIHLLLRIVNHTRETPQWCTRLSSDLVSRTADVGWCRSGERQERPVEN